MSAWLRSHLRSLQGQLLLVTFITTLLAWVGGIALTLTATRVALERLHDRELVEVAALIHGISGHELQEMGEDSSLEQRIANARADTHATFRLDYRYQIWSSSGRLLLSNFGQGSAAALSRFGHTGLSWIDMDGERWRVYALSSESLGQEVQVAERASLREISPEFDDAAFWALIVVSLAAAVLPGLWMARWLTQPVRQLVAELASRSPTNLKAVHVPQVTEDILPVVTAMNGLFERLAATLRHEAAFTALAAHELRTPLATLCLQAHAVKDPSLGEAERNRMVDELVQSAERCARLQDQLLTLSRLDTRAGADLNQEVELTEVVVEVLSDALPEARRQQVKLASQLDGSAIKGHRFGVETLIRNVIANAVRYTPALGRVEVRTAAREDTAIVTVDDSGPGIPPEHRARVFERFQRLQREQTSGVGLGLSIVRSVAEMHGAQVTLADSPLGGLRVTVEFVGRLIPRPSWSGEEDLGIA